MTPRSIDHKIAYWRVAADAAPSKQAALVAFGAVVGLTHAKEDHSMEAPRWIVDQKANVLTERQPDGSYAAAYELVPIPPTAPPQPDKDASARKLYEHDCDNHPTMHCNRFAAWSELDDSAKAVWRDRATRL